MQKPQKLKSRRDKGLIILVAVVGGGIALTYAIIFGVGTFGLYLAPGALGDSAPSWSPDGTRIAFSSDETGDQDIYVMSADGTVRVNLTSREAKDIEPAWSPRRRVDRLPQPDAGKYGHPSCASRRHRPLEPHHLPGPAL